MTEEDTFNKLKKSPFNDVLRTTKEIWEKGGIQWGRAMDCAASRHGWEPGEFTVECYKRDITWYT